MGDEPADERARRRLVHELEGADLELEEAGEEVRELPAGQPVPGALTTRIKDQLATVDAAGKSALSLVASAQGLAQKLSPLIDAMHRLLG